MTEDRPCTHMRLLRTFVVTGPVGDEVRCGECEQPFTLALPRSADGRGYDLAFEEVWAVHRRGPKHKALAQYQRAVPARVSHERLLSALRAYVAGFGPGFRGAHLFQWIKDSRWEEYEEPVENDIAPRRGSYLDTIGDL